MTEMHDVVEMLLNRMKDYPEDFVSGAGIGLYQSVNKWESALRLAQDVTTEKERAALETAMKEAKRAVYMGAALKSMLSDESEEEDKPYLTMKTQNRYAGFGSVPVKAEGSSIGYNTVANTINIGSAQLTEDKVNLITQLEQRQKAVEAQMKQQLAEKQYATNHA